MTIIWYMVPEIQSEMDRIFFFLVILGHFLHFNPPKNPKNQNFEKMKTTPGDIIILHMCTINDHHMMYASWDMECDRQNFFVISGQFLPFYLTHDWKNQNFEEKKKNPGDIIILHKCNKNHDHMLYCSWDMAGNCCNFYFSFWAIFCPFIPLMTWKIKIF